MTLSHFASRLSALALGLVLAACGGSGSSREATLNCATITGPNGQNEYVYSAMQHWYLWYDKLPTLNPANFESPQALLNALVAPVTGPVDRFSYLTTQAAEDALFDASQFVGFGFRQRIGADSVTVLDVFEDGPADQGGLDRGSQILEIDGVPIAEILSTEGGLSAALGPPEVGWEVEMRFTNRAGEDITATFVKDTVTIPPVTAMQVLEVDGVTTGYLVFRNFVNPGITALDEAFGEFQDAGVSQLIVDLRYNGGGLLRVVEHFANLLASRDNPGLPFYTYRHNDKNSDRDETYLFPIEPAGAALSLDKLVFITTGATASASEMLVNGLPPYVETATIGSTTFGKPVGQYGFRFCEQVLRPVSFQVVNGEGEGDYFDGLGPDCAAADNAAAPFGVAGEDSFDAALHWLSTGSCPAVGDVPPVERLRVEPAERPRYNPNDAV
jgi:carboxyl-terminal processing protease